MKDLSVDEWREKIDVEDMVSVKKLITFPNSTICNINVGSLSTEDGQKVVDYYKKLIKKKEHK